MTDKIMILDDETNHFMINNPSKTKALRDEFKLLSVDNMSNGEFNEYFIRDNYGVNMLQDSNFKLNGRQLDKVDNERSYCLTLSPVINGCLYPVDKFDEYYKEDLLRIMNTLAGFMGAKKYHFNFVKKEELKQSSKSELDSGVNVTYKDNGGDANFKREKEREREKKYDESEEISHQSKTSITKKKSKEDLREWIESNRINIESLPYFFRTLLDLYLESGELSGHLEYKKSANISNNILDKSASSANAKLNIANLPLNIGANFKFSKENKSNTLGNYCIQYSYEF